MARKKQTADAAQKAEAELDNKRRELFCRYYAQGEGTFGNATLSYAAAYDVEIGDLRLYDKNGNLLVPKDHIPAYNICSASGSRLLRDEKVQARLVVLRNELLRDEIVDAELAKVITQDGDLTPKVAAIKEFNKLRGRIIDHTKITQVIKFDHDDIRTLISFLPADLQQKFYATLTELITEAELRRRAVQGEVSRPQLTEGHTG